MDQPTVAAVVLTWNRAAMLARCLDALGAQTRPPDRILVIDNASSDGTADLVAQRRAVLPTVAHHRLSENVGAAGGFRACFAAALASAADYAWIMDDDVLPDRDALEALLTAAARLDEPFSFLASRVLGIDGQSMNVPEPDLRGNGDHYPDWDRRLDLGLVKIRRSSFVSVLVPHATLAHVAPPSADFVMWGEDADWSLRATAWRPAWLAAASRVIHARAAGGPPDCLAEGDPARLRRLFYFYRNEVYIAARHYGTGGVVRVVGGTLRRAIRIRNMRRLLITVRGLAAGWLFRPKDV